ncbi:pentatricopeptide repeat-containing protein At5g39710-like [Lotus japonicus]|uniref:pentatricopeptide repeat-containing protein At5g39710-like n=1 Tax=Lotus japonicus TaxID=34305 RepID=UPI00258B93A9|nr:pentatricopeptide repeat-containing protein At5g39710-like [Lotus japonicus]
MCKDKRKTEAEGMLKETNEKGLATDDNMIVLAHCNVRMVDEALETLRGMAEKGEEPDLVSIKAVLQVLCKDKRKTETEELLKEMNRKGLATDDNMIVLAHCNVGMIDEALDIFREMAEKGMNQIAFHSWKFFMDKRKVEADELLKETNGKSLATDDNMIVLAHCNVGMVDEASEIFRDMAEKGVKPDCLSFKAVLQEK